MGVRFIFRDKLLLKRKFQITNPKMVWPTEHETNELVSSILEKFDIPAGQKKARECNTNVEYVSNLNMYSTANKMRLSGIVCTIGPVSRSPEVLLELIENGMNIARMNFSHGTHEYHAQTMENVRIANKMYKEKHGVDPNLAIALDTEGPGIRTGLLEGDDGRKELTLKAGASIKITTDEAFKEKCTSEVLWLDYKNITKVMEPGKRLFIDDGLISVKCTEIGSDHFIGMIENDGNLGSKKGCNLPGTDTDLPAVSEKDKSDLLLGVEQGVDMVFASFIRSADGVKQIRDVLGEKGKNIWVIPKIENQQGIKNLTEIIACSEGLMVARGDMGIEIPTEKVFIAQKAMIAECNRAGKPVICATQMLESMVKKPRPTRAEASDVANAVLDGADCIMLSGETAKGDYPLESVRMQHLIAREAEAAMFHRQLFEELRRTSHLTRDPTESVAIGAVEASFKCCASAIVVLTKSGRSAHMLSRYRPRAPIIAVPRCGQTARQCHLYRGIYPVMYNKPANDVWAEDVDLRANFAMEVGKHKKFFKSGDVVIVVTGWRPGSGYTNTMRVVLVP